MVEIETLMRRATVRKLAPVEVREALVSWFVARAEPQVRRAMKYTSERQTTEELQRVLQMKARSIFARLASTWEAPTWADLRRAKRRMDSYLLPKGRAAREIERERELWDELLANQSAAAA